MQLAALFAGLGEERLEQLLRTISIGKLRTYQLYERFKIRTHLPKVNMELLRKAAPKFWKRIEDGDEEFATDLSQAILVSHLDMISAVLNFTGVPNQEGFFDKDLDAKQHLTEGWQGRAYDEFRSRFPETLLVFYLNHLGWETAGETSVWLPAAVPAA